MGGPEPVIGLPTGGTARGVYERLLRLPEGSSYTAARYFAVDEYLGLGRGDPNSYARELRECFLVPMGIPPDRLLTPDGLADDPDAEAARYEQAIARAGGLDFLMLGLGTNGHIGFNEPGSRADSRTRVVSLAAATRNANARFFGEAETPRNAITIGLATIFEARRIVLVATGREKAHALADMFSGGPVTDSPAAILTGHPHCEVVIDEAASTGIL